jgi:hypothetical protein
MHVIFSYLTVLFIGAFGVDDHVPDGDAVAVEGVVPCCR